MIAVMNRHIIQSNRKNNEKEPPIRVSKGRYGRPHYVNRIDGRNFSLIYDPDNPLPCGATAWLEYNE